MYPIKYIEDNLVFNRNGECYAYYELMPYNYGFLSVNQKAAIHKDFQQMVAQSRNGNIHALEIATEVNIRQVQEQGKKLAVGKLAEVARRKVDEQTEALVDMLGDENQLEYRFYLGFRLALMQEAYSIRGTLEQFRATFRDWLGEVGQEAMGGFLSMDNKEIRRYKSVEKMLADKLGRRFKMRPLNMDDFGYIVEHVYGMRGVSYDDYSSFVPKRKYKRETLVRRYEYLKLTRAELTERRRHFTIDREGRVTYATCFAVQEIVEDLDPMNSAIFYLQQKDFRFPVDTSMNVEVVENKKAVTKVRNQKKGLKDLDRHAYQSDNDTSDTVVSALEDANELESELLRTKEALYKLSYVVRVSADSYEELERRCDEVKDFYDEKGIKLVRPSGDMLGLHGEFLPASNRYASDYIQYIKADFLGGLGFGATQMLGERWGIYMGYNPDNERNVYINPALAAQGVRGSITNALSGAFLGSLGWGKSFCNNLLLYYIALFGGRVIILDPKSERGNWAMHLPELAGEINVLNLTAEERMGGVLDAFMVMPDRKDGEALAIDLLAFLTGINSRDGSRYPVLVRAVGKVGRMEHPGLLKVLDVLREEDTEVSRQLADHVGSFTESRLGHLLFGDGEQRIRLNMDKALNIVQVQDLVLPDERKPPEEYSTTDVLSVAAMLVLSTYCLDFIKTDRSQFKVVDLDEAWTFLNVALGKTLSNKLVREGRSRNAAIYFVTQNVGDLCEKDMKNNIGMKFAFRSTDLNEIRKVLEFFGLDPDDETLQDRIRNLGVGECLYQDNAGHTGVMVVHPVFRRFFQAFDTRPPAGTTGGVSESEGV